MAYYGRGEVCVCVGGGGGGEGGGMEVWEEVGIYLSLIVTTKMTPSLRWAAMGAILMFHNCEGQSHKTASTDPNF